MKARKLVLILSVVLALALSIGGTLAYLTDTDSDVNVMTLGNVEIEQEEKQRVDPTVHTGTAWMADEALEKFANYKPLYPAYAVNGAASDYTAEPTDLYYWGDYVGTQADRDAHKSTGGNGLWDPEKLVGAIDKFVFVKNIGASDAYFRTWIAFECPEGMTFGDASVDHIGANVNAGYEWEEVGYDVIEVDGEPIRFKLVVGTYTGWNDGVLTPGEVARPSLLQIVMSHKCNGEDVEKLGDTYEVLVVSQAVQTVNMPDAKTALNAGFGVPSLTTHPWLDASVERPGTGDPWDGTADISWYNDEDTEFMIMTAEQLAGFAQLVDEGNSFAGKTVKVGKDIDLYLLDENGERVTFDPIGDKSAFAGTFDGMGHTIENLYQSGWALGYEWGKYGSIGLFGELESATVKNLTIKGAETFVEGGDVSLIAGSATGTCVFENITLEDSVAATYNNGCGGIIGWSGAGDYTFKNIIIGEDVTLAGLWGSFDSSIGGVVGQAEPGATYNFENVDIACRLDVYNDCTASNDYYNYRMCGMVMGRLEATTTIDGRNYPDTSKYNITCDNVTVTYGDWYNYHYCEPTPGQNGGRGMRVESGYQYGGLPADYDHSQCVDNCKNLIPFDQIFGGDQYGVTGLKTYEGVTVTYPDK